MSCRLTTSHVGAGTLSLPPRRRWAHYVIQHPASAFHTCLRTILLLCKPTCTSFIIPDVSGAVHLTSSPLPFTVSSRPSYSQQSAGTFPYPELLYDIYKEPRKETWGFCTTSWTGQAEYSWAAQHISHGEPHPTLLGVLEAMWETVHLTHTCCSEHVYSQTQTNLLLYPPGTVIGPRQANQNPSLAVKGSPVSIWVSTSHIL